MTVPQNDRYIRYAPAALTTVMAYDFQIFVQGDIAVKRLRAGVETTLTLTTDYTVSGVGVLGGGNITLLVGSVAGDIYAIYGVNEYRSADYTQAGDFLASNVNNDMNKQMQISQQLRRDVDSCIRLNPLDSSFDTADLTIPVLADRLDKFLKFNEITGDLEMSDGSVNVDGTANQITVVGTTVSIANNPIIPGNEKIRIPSGTTAQRPAAPSNADFRYNSQTNDVEAYVNSAWRSLLNSSSGAPIGSTYITQTPDGSLTNEQALSILGTGIMKSTTGTGVISIDPGITSLSLLATVADRIAYSTALNTWAETPLTAAGRALIDDATAADQRTTLGLGTMAVQDASAVAITGGTLSGITNLVVDFITIDDKTISSSDVLNLSSSTGNVYITGTAASPAILSMRENSLNGSNIISLTVPAALAADYIVTLPAVTGTLLINANNLSDISNAATARTNLGLAIGTNVQAFDATLTSIASLGTAADKIAYTTGVDTWAETGLTAYGRTLINSAAASNARTTLALVIGTDVQAFDATLTALAAYNTNGILTQTSADTFAGRTITGTANKVTVTNGDGVSGNPTLTLPDALNLKVGATGLTLQDPADTTKQVQFTASGITTGTTRTFTIPNSSGTLALSADLSSYQPLDATLTALAAYNTNGILTQTAADTFAGRTITGTANEITLTNGSGVSGNPTISLPSALTFTGKTITGGTFTTPIIAQINDANGNASLVLASSASAVNYMQIANSATGNTPTFSALGTDTNISFYVQAKGSGRVVMYNSSNDSPIAFRNAAQSADAIWSLSSLTGTQTFTLPNITGNVQVNLRATGTEAANAVTASGTCGTITTSSLTTASAGSYAITWTNTTIVSTSTITMNVSGGTNTRHNVQLETSSKGAGSCTLTIYNNHASALNGTLLIDFRVVN